MSLMAGTSPVSRLELGTELGSGRGPRMQNHTYGTYIPNPLPLPLPDPAKRHLRTFHVPRAAPPAPHRDIPAPPSPTRWPPSTPSTLPALRILPFPASRIACCRKIRAANAPALVPAHVRLAYGTLSPCDAGSTPPPQPSSTHRERAPPQPAATYYNKHTRLHARHPSDALPHYSAKPAWPCRYKSLAEPAA